MEPHGFSCPTLNVHIPVQRFSTRFLGPDTGCFSRDHGLVHCLWFNARVDLLCLQLGRTLVSLSCTVLRTPHIDSGEDNIRWRVWRPPHRAVSGLAFGNVTGVHVHDRAISECLLVIDFVKDKAVHFFFIIFVLGITTNTNSKATKLRNYLQYVKTYKKRETRDKI